MSLPSADQSASRFCPTNMPTIGAGRDISAPVERPPVDVHHGALQSEIQVARGSEAERRETAHPALDQVRERRPWAADTSTRHNPSVPPRSLANVMACPSGSQHG